VGGLSISSGIVGEELVPNVQVDGERSHASGGAIRHGTIILSLRLAERRRNDPLQFPPT
jgi:hypothetical protein